MPEPRKKVFMAWPDIIPDTKRAPAWFKQPEPTPEQKLAPARKAHVSPLTKISKLLPAKLPKLTFSPVKRYKPGLR